MGLVTLSFSSYAGGPKKTVKEVIKTELNNANFIGEHGETGNLIVEFRINEKGQIIIEDSNSDNDQLANRFAEFIKTIQLDASYYENEVYKLRFAFRKY